MFLRRLLWKTTEERINPLSYAFLFITLAYGVGFLIVPPPIGVKTSGIWLSFSLLQETLPAIWGVAALLAITCWSLALTTRREIFAHFATLLGFMVWLFACIVLAYNQFWLVLFTSGLSNLYYWCWLYFAFMDYKRRREANTIVEP